VKFKFRPITFLPVFIWFVSLFNLSIVKAAPEPGLNITVYNNFGYNASPPLPDITGRPVQCTTTYPNIDQIFNSVCNLSDDFIVKYEGFITSPTDATIIFHPTADDGTKLYIDGTLIDNNWIDKGGGGNYSTAVEFTAGVPKPITFWYYENGGGAWVNLAWDLDGSFVTVPAAAFTKTSESAYTTTTTSSTTTTTVAPYFNAVQNLTAVVNTDGSVSLDWDAPASSNTAPYMYNILFYDLVDGVETSGWGVWTYATNTSYSLGPWMWPGTTGYGPVRFKIQAGTAPCVGEGNGSCLYGPQATVDATVVEPTPTTTTSPSTTTSTTTTEVSTTTSSSTTILPTTTTTTTEPVQTSTTTLVENTTTSTTTTTLPTTTTTEAPYTPPQTTTTSPTIETQPEPTTTEPDTTVDEPDTTEPETSTTDLPDLPEEPVETVETTIPETVVPDRVDEILPDETEQPEDISEPQEDTAETEQEQVEDSLDDYTLPEDGEAIIAEELDNIIDEVFTEDVSADVFVETLTTLLDAELTDEQLTEVLDSAFSEEASVENMVSALDAILDGPIDAEDLEKVIDAVFDGDLSDDETVALAKEVLKGELTADEFATVIDAIFDEVVTDKVLIETFTAVLETELNEEKFEEIVNVLESKTISNEQVAEVVTLIIEQEGGVNAEQATELATSEKVLESIDGEQATEVFDAVVASEVSPEDGLAISEAVQEAPKEVRKAFEKELNVFEGVFDVYVPMGSRVPVGDRRVIVGVGAVLLSVPVRVRVG